MDFLAPRDRRGRSSLLSAEQLLCALSYHCIHGLGKLSSNVMRLTGIKISDSALFRQRHKLPVELMDLVSKKCLNVLSADKDCQNSHYKSRLLVGLDGTTFKLRNTEDISSKTRKRQTRNSKQGPMIDHAFALLPVNCLVELGAHNPLAVRVGLEQEGEITLGYDIIKDLPEDFMLLADRLYGCAYFVSQLMEQCKQKKGAFLIRVNESTTCEEIVETLSDGSKLVEVPVRERQISGRRSQIVDTLLVREIRARVCGRDGKWFCVRFWTDLLQPRENPAEELLKLYLRRWEHELYFRELKRELKTTDLLTSNTLLCAMQEVIVSVWATALIAKFRNDASLNTGNTSYVISFEKAYDKIKTIWDFIAIAGMSLPQNLVETVLANVIEELKRECIPRRRPRSCPRTRRRINSMWPKTTKAISHYGEFQIEIIHNQK